jgi:hypothetical protein
MVRINVAYPLQYVPVNRHVSNNEARMGNAVKIYGETSGRNSENKYKSYHHHTRKVAFV